MSTSASNAASLRSLFAPALSQHWTRRANHGCRCLVRCCLRARLKLTLVVVVGDHVYVDGGEIFVGAAPFDMSVRIDGPSREGDHIAGMISSYFVFESGSLFFD